MAELENALRTYNALSADRRPRVFDKAYHWAKLLGDFETEE